MSNNVVLVNATIFSVYLLPIHANFLKIALPYKYLQVSLIGYDCYKFSFN